MGCIYSKTDFKEIIPSSSLTTFDDFLAAITKIVVAQNWNIELIDEAKLKLIYRNMQLIVCQKTLTDFSIRLYTYERDDTTYSYMYFSLVRPGRRHLRRSLGYVCFSL